MCKLLIVDDDKGIRRTLELHFQTQQHKVKTANSVNDGLAIAQFFVPNIIILDIRMEGKSGLEGISEFKQLCPSARIIMITAFHDMQSTIEAMQNGADEYIHKPLDLDEIDAAVGSALQYQNISTLDAISIPDSSGNSIVGCSKAMKEIFKNIGRVAMTNAAIMITGESGTGKEMVAKAIHNAGNKTTQPFVAINCAALVETLLESEMFGHKKGAFTGAVSDQMGKFELAQDGTLFLDEVGELAGSIQAKLLRVLQEKVFTPVGGKKSQTTNARIICATNIDFQQAIKDKTFREDLFYRLQVVRIHIPPLRERKEDLPLLIPALLARINRDLDTQINQVARDAMEALCGYDWPGNVRQLENLLTKAVALCSGKILTLDLFEEIKQQAIPSDADANTDSADLSPQNTYELSLQDIELKYTIDVLKRVAGHKGKACDILKISRPRLQRILERIDAQS
ncbi:sigma-54-dependent transcriptional regulator [Moritella viscosa]|uniref:Helix-turn-helix, Fis-type n=1 Tax=Moritella viscosa TaxID=80854 RepID=A0A090K7L0_9GAMM|nr:sigma-54 dependent transcriptional regulator [Moritella viscosa]CED59798.1 sigma-54 dependent transcriptional regulator [Moritella viscosa]SGY92576.1 Helix-turn-helix, Fis-type [Moritella viscosa]SGY93142.1 Helix-turn-helix, Fis-type [Moritella viscosa]SGZ01213.1 Helix-turn-helix, Fis-type [Moritella viscosa]SHO02523.1 Helix-turn-helix, Fis-type [Moritella viscosa]